MFRWSHFALSMLGAGLLISCGGEESAADAGASPDVITIADGGIEDAGTQPREDAGTPDAGDVDAGSPIDAGTDDAGAPPDAGAPDAGMEELDGGTPQEDAGVEDAGTTDPADAGVIEDAGTSDPVDAGFEADAGSEFDAGSEPADAGPPIGVVEAGEAAAAGTETTYLYTAQAYDQPLPGLRGAARTKFFLGQTTFQIDWVAPPSSSDKVGLGPTFNATSCKACHTANGRTAPFSGSNGGALVTALLRVSIPGQSVQGGPLAHPTYGDQIEPFAIAGVSPEGTVSISFSEVASLYADGQPYSLQIPTTLFQPNLGDPGADLLQSVRTASPTYGLGFLAAIPEASLLALADPNDVDGDGISGHPNWVWDEAAGALSLGRFGWKANQPTLNQQNSGAFRGDVGVTSPLFPMENCPAPQMSCLSAPPSSVSPEASAARMEALLVYSRGVSVPGRRNVGDTTVLRGKYLFHSLQCASCHVPSLTTGDVPDYPQLAYQQIWPYTDLLLHDMGPGLADGRPDFSASESEWRTPPLWGLGLQQTVSGHTRLLHDGRARNPAEAILWHGGEAASSAEGFRQLSQADRDALLAFLQSL